MAMPRHPNEMGASALDEKAGRPPSRAVLDPGPSSRTIFNAEPQRPRSRRRGLDPVTLETLNPGGAPGLGTRLEEETNGPGSTPLRNLGDLCGSALKIVGEDGPWSKPRPDRGFARV